MKKMWKNVLGIVLVAAISAGAAVGTSAYLINKNQPVFGTSGSANTFNQPIRLAGYNTVAAENTDFTTAAESTVHGVVHIKATTNAKQYADGGNQPQYVDPFEYFFGFGGRGVPTPATATTGRGRFRGDHFDRWIYYNEQSCDRWSG